jgi:hypothetical protein
LARLKGNTSLCPTFCERYFLRATPASKALPLVPQSPLKLGPYLRVLVRNEPVVGWSGLVGGALLGILEIWAAFTPYGVESFRVQVELDDSLPLKTEDVRR